MDIAYYLIFAFIYGAAFYTIGYKNALKKATEDMQLMRRDLLKMKKEAELELQALRRKLGLIEHVQFDRDNQQMSWK